MIMDINSNHIPIQYYTKLPPATHNKISVEKYVTGISSEYKYINFHRDLVYYYNKIHDDVAYKIYNMLYVIYRYGVV